MEALPNVHYRGNGRPPTPVSDAVVVGAVVDVEEGYSFGHQGGGEVDEQARRDFDDDDALWKTVRLVVRVDETLGCSSGRDARCSRCRHRRLGPGRFHGVWRRERRRDRSGLQGPWHRCVVLHRGTAVYRYDPSLFAVLDDGALIAPVDDSGKLSLPFVDPGQGGVLLASASTLDGLRERARDEVRTPRVDTLARIAEGAGGSLVLELAWPQTSRLDLERNGRVLADLLDLADHLPRRPKPRLEFPPLAPTAR